MRWPSLTSSEFDQTELKWNSKLSHIIPKICN